LKHSGKSNDSDSASYNSLAIERHGERKLQIGIFGTFDVETYGDLGARRGASANAAAEQSRDVVSGRGETKRRYAGMKTASLILIILLVSSFGSITNGAQNRQSAAVSPDAVVKELYRVHRKGYGPLFEKKGKTYHEKFFDRNLAGLIWKDLTETPADMVGNLDFDPLFNAQDIRITGFRIGAPVVEGENVTVPVGFKNFGKKTSMKFMMVNESGVWKIANIDYGDGNDLVKLLNTPL